MSDTTVVSGEVIPNRLFLQSESVFVNEDSPNFRFWSLFDRSHFLLLILLILCEKVGLGSNFLVASVYILLKSCLKNNQPVKLEKSKCSKYVDFS